MRKRPVTDDGLEYGQRGAAFAKHEVTFARIAFLRAAASGLVVERPAEKLDLCFQHTLKKGC